MGEGLRARKQAKVRSQLAEAALRLFVERGYEQTTVEDVAEAAMVSRSTFFRYFASKDDAVLWQLDLIGAELLAAYRARPAEEPAWTALCQAVLASTRAQPQDGRTLTLMELTWNAPVLRARRLDKVARWRTELTALTRDRMASSAVDPLPVLLVHAALAAADAGLAAWAAARGEADLTDLIGQALARLGSGLADAG